MNSFACLCACSHTDTRVYPGMCITHLLASSKADSMLRTSGVSTISARWTACLRPDRVIVHKPVAMMHVCNDKLRITSAHVLANSDTKIKSSSSELVHLDSVHKHKNFSTAYIGTRCSDVLALRHIFCYCCRHGANLNTWLFCWESRNSRPIVRMARGSCHVAHGCLARACLCLNACEKTSVNQAKHILLYPGRDANIELNIP